MPPIDPSRKSESEVKLDDLFSNFLQAAGDLFRSNQDYIRDFEGGRYLCAYLTPSKRLRQAMAADREVLLVVSTFSDQQQRIIKFVQAEISDSKGRLEPTVAIVIHVDPSGNMKLRNWGRDLGISVLPIDAINGFRDARDIERKLANQLFSHDPFDVTGPVSGESNFFGRRDEAIDLARKLQTGQIRSCLGIRKVGKTSIINRVLKEVPNLFDCAVIMIDCSKDDVFEMNASNLLSSIASTLEDSSSSDADYATIRPKKSDASVAEARRRLESAVISCEHVVLIVFDEIDYITPGSPTSPEWRSEFNVFWRNLRAVYQDCDRRGKPMSLLIGGVSTHWFTVGEIQGVENAALAFVPEEFLSPMAKGATIAMLRRLGKVAGLSFSEEAAEIVAIETGNMPYWARKCCSYIHRKIPLSDRPKQLSVTEISPLVEDFVKNEGCQIAEVAISHLFRVHPDMMDVCRHILSGEASETRENLRRTLRQYGVTTTRDEFSGKMFENAVKTVMAEPQVPVRDRAEPRIADEGALGEWAEELAALGQRRNLLERRLRGIALNFLRMDAMINQKLDTLNDNIKSVLPSSRRKILSGYDLENLFQKLMWLELIGIITRNWSVFEKIFGDKKAFEGNAELINDRPDAHAKEWDRADFALYRRSLTWFEDRVTKLQ